MADAFVKPSALAELRERNPALAEKVEDIAILLAEAAEKRRDMYNMFCLCMERQQCEQYLGRVFFARELVFDKDPCKKACQSPERGCPRCSSMSEAGEPSPPSRPIRIPIKRLSLHKPALRQATLNSIFSSSNSSQPSSPPFVPTPLVAIPPLRERGLINSGNSCFANCK